MRLLIIDDHPMTCAGLKSLLQAYYPDAEIEARHLPPSPAELSQRWDHIFLDMHLPGFSFRELLDLLAGQLSRVILISAAPEPEAVELARGRGVRGLLPKNADVEHILDGFRRIRSGDPGFIDPTDLTGGRKLSPSPLTERQRDVFDALLGGLSNKQIARSLGISEHTVKDHVTAILTIFGVRNRLELVLQQRQPPVV